uniref:Uncharacterized protein n=1 Tax=Brassica oleracea var. oleracea TaxID=109376 RepID=A0A0D3DGG9_BRAOL
MSSDRPWSTDQYMEPNQHGDQNVLKISTEVHVFHHPARTLYWTVPHATGWELWLEPWPDDRFQRTEFCIHCPVSHFMKNSRDGITFRHTNLEILRKPKVNLKNCLEKLKDFSDSIPIFDESDEEPIESLIICEQSCDLSSLEPEFMVDNEQAIVELTVLQPEHPSSFDLSYMFDEEDESGPVFDDEEKSIMSTFMKSQLCFDSSTSPTPLSFELQEYCEEPSFLNSIPDMFVKISTHDVIRFGLDKMKEFCVSKSVFDNMINSFKVFEPDKFLDQPRSQNVKGINSGFILCFDQFLEDSHDFDHFEKSLELDLKQTVFCSNKSFDSFVFKENSFDLNSSRHRLITDHLLPSSCALDKILIQKLLENKSLKTENDFCDLDFCDFISQPGLCVF